MTRQKRTPRQRAEEQLGVAERAVKKLTAQAKRFRADLEAVDQELTRATARRDYLKRHPDLAQPRPVQDRTTRPSTGDTST